MKRIVTLLSAVAAALMLCSISVVAEYGTEGLQGKYGPGGKNEYSGQQMQKDQCLLVAKNCKGEFDTMHQRIEKLRIEIDKGAAVYTRGELDQLSNQLIWLHSEGNNVF